MGSRMEAGGESERGGGPGGGKQRGPAGVVAVRTDGGEQGASYSGISPDSVGAGHDLANGLASPARRHPSGSPGSCAAPVCPLLPACMALQLQRGH